MYLKKTKTRNGKIHLAIVDTYYDKSKKCSRTKTIESLGYLEELEKLYDDPIAHFSKRVDELKSQKVELLAPIKMEFKHSDTIDPTLTYSKNFGYTALSRIYHDLGIHTFLTNRQRYSKEDYDADTIMKLLVYSRLLYPASKKKTYENRSCFFEKENYSLDDVYRCLSFFNKHRENLMLWINGKIKQLYGRDTSLVYYDVTNYYFETDDISDDFKKKGISKEHRPNPIVQMGLFMDNNGIPITYQLFPGNTNDCLTFRPNLKKIKMDYDLGKVVIVADKGMTTGDNIWYTLSAKDGYVFSMSVRGADKELKDYVLNEDGYEWLGNEYKRKSRLYPRSIQVTATSGRKIKKTVDEKQVVFYSEKYDKRAKAERAAALARAHDLANNPGKYTRATSYGASKYIKKIDFDADTGEILKATSTLEIDEEKLREEEALDGYYVIVTSEMNETDDRIIEMYRGLWRIEESFRVTKSDLEARPVYVSTKDHIEAHFLTCFVSLVIARILEMKLEHKYCITKLLETLRKTECCYAQQNYYLFNYYDDVIADIGNVFGIDYSKRIRTLGEIKKVLASTKK
ncbi:MAG: IS1634 family transposase [Tepidanaerobacteraceae bacterium]|nr:IS1634 family transposase [Tepidanaerobacteraceae bacterium]